MPLAIWPTRLPQTQVPIATRSTSRLRPALRLQTLPSPSPFQGLMLQRKPSWTPWLLIRSAHVWTVPLPRCRSTRILQTPNSSRPRTFGCRLPLQHLMSTMMSSRTSLPLRPRSPHLWIAPPSKSPTKILGPCRIPLTRI